MSGQRSSTSPDPPEPPDGAAGPDAGLNPFSFKEFLRWKALDPDQEQDPGQDPGQEQQVSGVGGVACAAGSHFLSPQEVEQTGRGRSFQAGVDSPAFSCTEEEEEEEEEEEARFSRTAAEEHRPVAEAPTPWGRRSSGRSPELQEENTLLRRTIRELQKRVTQLSEELLRKRQQEQEEAQHLESMVQSVEHNLRLMTRRAARAESSVSRLTAELQQLQAQVGSLRSENSALKTAEAQVVMTMRHNARTASEHLSRMAEQAGCSLRQLMGAAETLHLVSQLLQSIDRVSQLHPES